MPARWQANLAYTFESHAPEPLTLQIGMPFNFPPNDEGDGETSQQEVEGFQTAFDGVPLEV